MKKVMKVHITQIRSALKRPQDQAATLIGLGLKRLHQTRVLEYTPSIMGMVMKVRHLVDYKIVETKEKA